MDATLLTTPVLQLYVNGDNAPTTVAVAVPVQTKQKLFVEAIPTLIAAPFGNVVLAVCVHPLASVTVTVFSPALKPNAVAVVSPLVQRNVYGASPPEGATVACPSEPPKQVGATLEVIEANTGAGSSIVKVTTSLHIPSATVTV